MEVSLGTLIGQAGTFLVLVLVTMKYVWPPLTQAMEERRQKIAEGLAQSDRAEVELDEARQKAEQIVREARAKSGEIIDNASKRGNEIVEQAKHEAVEERERQVAAAEAEIKLAANQAREALRGKMAELTIAGAQRVIQQELDSERHRKLIDQLTEEL
jgi:F-type H+-transporting ATPase subunit b